MKDYIKTDEKLILVYSAESTDNEWVEERITNEGFVRIAPTFIFSPKDKLDRWKTDFDSEEYSDDHQTGFLLAVRDGEYYRIPARIIGTKRDVLLHKDLVVHQKIFEAVRRISIFPRLDEVIEGEITIGGDRVNAIPISEFHRLLRKFPNTTEVDKYARARISNIVADYVNLKSDPQREFEDYLKNKKTFPEVRADRHIIEFEVEKFEYIRAQIIEFLDDENAFSESEWQNLIVNFILLIFPKYIYVMKEVSVRDFYSPAQGRPKYRRIDLALVDAEGHVDILELKKPFERCLMSDSAYRENHTPRRELAGTIMQAEKYIFHLSKWGVDGEKKIASSQIKKGVLPKGFKIRITNPKAMIIAGRSNNLNSAQMFDFEILKRKYSNIMDIMSYDDLLARLTRIIERFRTV